MPCIPRYSHPDLQLSQARDFAGAPVKEERSRALQLCMKIRGPARPACIEPLGPRCRAAAGGAGQDTQRRGTLAEGSTCWERHRLGNHFSQGEHTQEIKKRTWC